MARHALPPLYMDFEATERIPVTHDAPTPAPERRHRKWPWVLLAIACFVALVNIANHAAATRDSGASTGAARTAATPTPGLEPVAAPAADSSAFTVGTYEVGTELMPGKYKTVGPPSADYPYLCYYARLSGTDGSDDHIIANDTVQGPMTLTVKASDVAVQFSGDCTWIRQ